MLVGNLSQVSINMEVILAINALMSLQSNTNINGLFRRILSILSSMCSVRFSTYFFDKTSQHVQRLSPHLWHLSKSFALLWSRSCVFLINLHHTPQYVTHRLGHKAVGGGKCPKQLGWHVPPIFQYPLASNVFWHKGQNKNANNRNDIIFPTLYFLVLFLLICNLSLKLAYGRLNLSV